MQNIPAQFTYRAVELLMRMLADRPFVDWSTLQDGTLTKRLWLHNQIGLRLAEASKYPHAERITFEAAKLLVANGALHFEAVDNKIPGETGDDLRFRLTPFGRQCIDAGNDAQSLIDLPPVSSKKRRRRSIGYRVAKFIAWLLGANRRQPAPYIENDTDEVISIPFHQTPEHCE